MPDKPTDKKLTFKQKVQILKKASEQENYTKDKSFNDEENQENPSSNKKLMTFVEWLAKKMGVNKDLAKVSFEMLTHTATAYGVHNKDCIFDNRLSKSLNENYLDSDLCRLCMLEDILSEYHKYFKQK